MKSQFLCHSHVLASSIRMHEIDYYHPKLRRNFAYTKRLNAWKCHEQNPNVE